MQISVNVCHNINDSVDWQRKDVATWSYVCCLLHYTECHRRKGPNFGRVFLMLNYTDITQNTYIQS